jgi:RNA polymerase sigma factor (sigma-70 family)
MSDPSAWRKISEKSRSTRWISPPAPSHLDVKTEPAPGDVTLADTLACDPADRAHLFGLLLRRAREGDREAAWDLFSPYRDYLWRAVYRMLGKRQDAEDTLQETWMRAIRGIGSFEGTTPQALRKWLLTIAINCFRENLSQRIKTRQRTVPMDATFDSLSDDGVDPDRIVLLMKLQALLATLPPKFRQVVELVDVYGFTREETARLLKRPLGTVNSQLHTARTTLKRAWLVDVDE